MTDVQATTIAPDGDTVLFVGTEMKTKLRVSSRTLSDASPEFKTIFKPYHRAGQDVKIAITLSDDDPTAIEAICEYLHNKPPRYTIDTSTELLTLATAIDKYKLVETLRPQCLYLLQRWLGGMPIRLSSEPMLVQIIAASSLLTQRPAFKTATAAMVKNTRGKIVWVGDLASSPSERLLLTLLRKFSLCSDFDERRY